MLPILAQIQERVGPAPKPEDIKAFSIVHLYFQASLDAGARHHDGSVHDMPLRHTTSGVQNHPRPDTRGSTTVPCPSRSSAPAHSPAPAASVHPAAPPGLHALRNKASFPNSVHSERSLARTRSFWRAPTGPSAAHDVFAHWAVDLCIFAQYSLFLCAQGLFAPGAGGTRCPADPGWKPTI